MSTNILKDKDITQSA